MCHIDNAEKRHLEASMRDAALLKQIYHFGDIDSLDSLAHFVGYDSPALGALVAAVDKLEILGEDLQPWSWWTFRMDRLDMPEFEDLVSKMTHLDPRVRITAWEALEHPWFQDM